MYTIYCIILHTIIQYMLFQSYNHHRCYIHTNICLSLPCANRYLDNGYDHIHIY